MTLVLALMAGLGKLSSIPPLRWLSIAYIEVFRGTSALVQLFWFFYVLPLFGVELQAILVGIVVLGLNVGSYGAEVVRGAIQDVPKGQWEAGKALNFTHLQTLWRIIVPQAVVNMVPPFGNLFIELLKNSALVSFITIADLTFQGKIMRDSTGQNSLAYGSILLIYFLVALCITAGMRILEARLSRGLDRGGVK